jgi:hypothetical protein
MRRPLPAAVFSKSQQVTKSAFCIRNHTIARIDKAACMRELATTASSVPVSGERVPDFGRREIGAGDLTQKCFVCREKQR